MFRGTDDVYVESMPTLSQMTKMLDDGNCWDAVLAHDASQDGRFYYGVLTTGVYCRPSCASRRPKRENVRFYSSPADAERDGLRPCRRCHPSATDPLSRKIQDLCSYIAENADAPITLADLAARAQLSPSHLQRAFKAVVGVSPKQYLDGIRMDGFKRLLRTDKKHGVTGAIFDAGFGSLSRLYEKADTRLGMTPMEYRQGGRGVEITYGSARTALGLMMVGATDRGLCFVQFGDSEAALLNSLRDQYPSAALTPLAAGFERIGERRIEVCIGRRHNAHPDGAGDGQRFIFDRHDVAGEFCDQLLAPGFDVVLVATFEQYEKGHAA